MGHGEKVLDGETVGAGRENDVDAFARHRGTRNPRCDGLGLGTTQAITMEKQSEDAELERERFGQHGDASGGQGESVKGSPPASNRRKRARASRRLITPSSHLRIIPFRSALISVGGTTPPISPRIHGFFFPS